MSDKLTEAANLLEELTDECEAHQEWEEELRDPQAWWKRKVRKAWEVAKAVASLTFVLWIGWVIYDQYPESRGVIKTLAGAIAVLLLLGLPGIIARRRRRKDRRREFVRRELATIKEVLNERL